MRVLVDTSAFYAVVCDSDRWHPLATRVYDALLRGQHGLSTPSTAVVETAALIQKRIGLEPLAPFRESLERVIDIIAVDAELLRSAWDDLEQISRRGVNLADCCLAAVAREWGIQHVFAFDPHFEIWGLEAITLDTLTSAEDDT